MSVLKGKYLIQNPWARFAVYAFDTLLRFFLFHKRHFPLSRDPEKILLCNTAFVGDFVISTAVLKAVKRKYPNAKIGFLVSSKSAAAAKNHPLVDWIHLFDHWYVRPSFQSVLRHWEMKKKAVKEIQSIGYDAAIDLHPYFPNAAAILYSAKIPVRIGYESGGFGPLFTHAFAFRSTSRYLSYAMLELLHALKIEADLESPLPFYPICPRKKIIPGVYLVIHMGTSSELKEWPLESWKTLIQKLDQIGRYIVFTGQGAREKQMVQAASAETKNGIDLVDRLSWIEFVQVIQQASLLISVDSASIHIAAAGSVPTVALFCGISAMPMWLPPHPNCKGLIHDVLCSPCFNKRGCLTMSCIRRLSPQTVWEAVGVFL